MISNNAFIKVKYDHFNCKYVHSYVTKKKRGSILRILFIYRPCKILRIFDLKTLIFQLMTPVTKHHRRVSSSSSSSSIQFWSGFIAVHGGGWIYPTLTAVSPTSTLISLNSWHPPSPNQHSFSPSPLSASSTSSCIFYIYIQINNWSI